MNLRMHFQLLHWYHQWRHPYRVPRLAAPETVLQDRILTTIGMAETM